MGLTEIVLIILGAIVLILSYVLPMGKGSADTGVRIDDGLIRGLVEKEVRDARNHIKDMVEETLTYSMEKTERSMERLTNEKIMAVNEYSEQVLESINKSHQEVIFLYDMLNDKHETFVNTVGEADMKMKKMKQEVQDIEVTVKEAMGSAIDETEEPEQKAASESGKMGEKEAGEQAETGFLPFAPKRVDVSDWVLQDVKENSGNEAMLQQQNATIEKEEQSYNNNNNEKILRLHKLGKSETAIAKDLGLGVGEVKLVIDLFKQAK